MALIMNNILTEFGLTIGQSYARIDTISGSKNNLMFTLNYYTSQQAFTEGKSYIKQDTYTFVPSVEDDALNFIKQGYEYLKSLPEFENAIDVLE